MQPRLFYLHALSPLHCGTGQSGGVVDLPIARARASQLPIVPSSSLRGVLRQRVTDTDAEAAMTLFGPRSIRNDQDAFAGALTIGDAHLLLLPVRCLAGVVSYVTSPFILKMYARDLALAGESGIEFSEELAPGTAEVVDDTASLVDQTLVLEDLDLKASKNTALSALAKRVASAVHPTDSTGQRDLARRVALVPDEIMSFLAETATEIRARIAVDAETGTVRQGALWYEENLPAESVLWGISALSDSRGRGNASLSAMLDRAVSGALLQVGGSAGVGRGLIRLRLSLGATR